MGYKKLSKIFLVLLLILMITVSAISCGKQNTAPPSQSSQNQNNEKEDNTDNNEVTVEFNDLKLMRKINPMVENTTYTEAVSKAGHFNTFVYYLTDSFASEDGKFPLVKDDGEKNLKLYVVSKDLKTVLTADRIEAEYAEKGYPFYLLGWKGNKLYYLKAEKDGEKIGFSAYSFDTADRNKKKIAFIEIEHLYIGNFKFLPEEEKAIIFVPGKYIQLELASGNITLLKSDLPSYDGLFYPQISPDGKYIAYSLLEPERRGIYVFDVDNKKEVFLARAGERDYFTPRWSPDGRYLAFYYVVKNEKGDFEYVEGEDGPYPIGDGIRVIDFKENKEFDIALQGMRIGFSYFNEDSNYMIFSSITRENAKELNKYSVFNPEKMNSIAFDGLWIYNLKENKAKKINDENVKMGFYPALIFSEEEYYFYKTIDGGWKDFVYYNQGSRKVIDTGYRFIPERYQNLKLIKGNLIIVGINNGEISIFIVNKGERKEIFRTKGVFWEYNIINGNIVLFYNDEQEKEKLTVISL